MGDILWTDANLFTTGYSVALPDGVAGNTVYKKIGIWNQLERAINLTLGISQFGVSDLVDWLTWGLCPKTISCPFNVEASLIAGGSLTASVTYYYRITAYNLIGESVGCLEVSQTTTISNKSIKLVWDALAGAEGYIIYRSTNQDYTNARRAIIEDPATLEWTDTGQSSSPSGPYSFPSINEDYDLPSENTTGGDSPTYYTDLPTFSTDDLVISLEPGEQKAVIVKIVVPITASESYNPRNAYINLVEN